MNLFDNVLPSPVHRGIATVAAVAASHLAFAMDLLVTGGIGVVGAYFTWRAHNNKKS